MVTECFVTIILFVHSFDDYLSWMYHGSRKHSSMHWAYCNVLDKSQQLSKMLRTLKMGVLGQLKKKGYKILKVYIYPLPTLHSNFYLNHNIVNSWLKNIFFNLRFGSFGILFYFCKIILNSRSIYCVPGIIVNIGLIKNLVGIFPCNIMGNLNKLLANPMGRPWKQWQTLFFWAPESLQMVSAVIKLKDAYSLEGKRWET